MDPSIRHFTISVRICKVRQGRRSEGYSHVGWRQVKHIQKILIALACSLCLSTQSFGSEVSIWPKIGQSEPFSKISELGARTRISQAAIKSKPREFQGPDFLLLEIARQHWKNTPTQRKRQRWWKTIPEYKGMSRRYTQTAWISLGGRSQTKISTDHMIPFYKALEDAD